jgi:hypothetical protein
VATDRLKIYNGALQICKVREIEGLTVNEEARRQLDLVWNDGGVEYCLEQAQWLFARRTSKFTYDTGITPSFGYRRAFAKPVDWLNTSALCADEYFAQPHNAFADEGDFWYSDLDEIYVKYTSKDPNWGLNLARWPNTFIEYVKTFLASKVVGKLSGDTAREAEIIKPNTGMLARALMLARNKNQMGEPARYLPAGSWVRARVGRSANTGGYDGGSNHRLIG